ncbi:MULTISPECIES: hypothetical protein [Streptomyces]|uniref:Uncharacterized protein n=1 Tax=Streptomyces lonegramiae TaxID=3075524 RepID=A0ABU2XMN5_9ACTN|nr:hypothetical protein [Streptomyces sp. DSM 41529]MDT0546722.1 hypothetical protein [Streptomyces sp. DSM 41529]
MGSLRNPIGPLPSSIYWRRRAVALAFLILVLLLAIWAFGWGGSGGGGGKDEGKGSGGGGAASTITPGPTSSTPVNSQRPGGRDESDDAGTGGDDTGGADSGGSGDGTDTGGAGGDGSAAGSDGDGGGTGGSLGIGDGQSVPAGSSLAACTPGAVELTVRSVKDSRVKNTYEPGEEPTFEIIVKNSSDTACKVDFGRAAASLTITDAENDHVWASDDCPKGSKSVLVEVAGKGQTKRTVDWDRKRSAEDCAKPSGDASAKPGTYLVEAKVEGLGTARVSFVLNKG